jgi:hypothetical protein
MSSRTSRLCSERIGVRPAIIAKQKARLIWPGSASELRIFRSFAIKVSMRQPPLELWIRAKDLLNRKRDLFIS